MVRLARADFHRPADVLAPALLGCLLCHRVDGRVRRARIVETEAYVGEHDLACHARRGRTPRNNVMYGPAGHAYVYFVYGMHDMLNVVASGRGDPQAVLVRAAEPVANVAARMDGPGRLCRAMGITVDAHNGADLCRGSLWVEGGPAPSQVVRSARIGVDFAGPWAQAPLRFLDGGSRDVSHAPRRPAGAASGPSRAAATGSASRSLAP